MVIWPELHALEREECEGRVDVETAGEYERVRLLAGSATCPPPETDRVVEGAYQRLRTELLHNKYANLVTRQFLRDDRWLEYTLRLLQEVNTAEAKGRYAILVDEAVAAAQFDLLVTRLALLCVQGTEGTVVHVEEVERETRFHGITYDEVQQREELSALFWEGFECVVAVEDHRCARYRQLFAQLADSEWEGRFLLQAEEDALRCQRSTDEGSSRNTVASLLLWRVEVTECNERVDLERAVDALWELDSERLRELLVQTMPPLRACSVEVIPLLVDSSSAEDGNALPADAQIAAAPTSLPPLVQAVAATVEEHDAAVTRVPSPPVFTDEMLREDASEPRYTDEEVQRMWNQLSELPP